jgi:TonB family protein
MTLFVAPQYPPGAAGEGIQATVDVIGMVREDGTLGPTRLEVKPEREDFRKAVEEVMAFWILYPKYDDTCHYTPVEGQVRVWFEIKDGKPIVSFSMPRRKEAAPLPGAPAEIYRAIRKTEIRYPYAARREGREGTVVALLHVPDTGEVERIAFVPGRHNEDFSSEVYEGLKRWKFPATPRPLHCFEYTIEFRLR